jgi:hypothetical protein
MPEKRATYRIDENLLRKTLLGYSVEVDAARCSAIENEASALRMQKSISLPDTKVLIKYVALPLLLIAGGIAIYANMDSIQEAFTPAPQIQTPAKKISLTHTTVKTPTVVAAKIIPPPAQNDVVAKKDSIVVTNKVPDSAKKQNNKQALPVVADPPTDTATLGKTEDLSKISKPDTASKKSNDPPVKKKKKRRHRSNNIDDLKESTLQPNSAEDDVVVPQ